MIGKTISHYHLLEKLGGGGMGTVYKAEDTRLRRTVALKFLAPELTRGEDAKKRFVHEAQAASALDHPNICSIFDIDETPEGQLYIVMACYDGESLKHRIARRKIEVREAFEIAYSIAQGLARAHAGGIVHRDIKPANVMITADGFVKIVDFGLAKLAGRSRITGSGATVGTVAYMSPEQARGEESDERTDIWSLGAVLYEMITGRTPFRGDIDQAMVYSILNEEPVPMEERRPDVPEACRTIVAKCLEKNPDKRYPNAEACCDAMEGAARAAGWGSSFPKGTVSAVSRFGTSPPRSRRQVLVGLAAGVVLAIGVPIGWRVVRDRATSSFSTEIRLAVLPFERLGDTPPQAFVDGLSYWVAGVFDRASRFHESMWCVPYSTVFSDYTGDPKRVKDTFGVNRVVTGEVTPYEQAHRLTINLLDARTMRTISTQSITLDTASPTGLAAAVVQAASRMFDISNDEKLTEKLTGLGTASPAAYGLYFEGLGNLFRKPKASSEAAIRSLTAALELDPSFSAARAALGYGYHLCFQTTANENCAALAGDELRAAWAADSSAGEAPVWLAWSYSQTRRLDDAIAALQSVLDRDSLNIDANVWLGRYYAANRRYREAEQVYRAFVRRRPDYFAAHWNLGWVYRQTGQREQEFAAYSRAFALAPGHAVILNSLGLYYSDSGDRRQAREFWERSFLARPSCGTCGNLGWVTYFEGQYGASARWYEMAFEYCDTTGFEPWANLAGALYWTDGGRDRSIRLYRHAIELAEKRLARTPGNPKIAAWLADFYSMVGDKESALRMIDVASSSHDPEVMYRLAVVYEYLGDRSQAIHYAGEALRRDYPLFEITESPFMRDLAKDPRFQQMAQLAKANNKEPTQ